jgi:hypothetical protein
VYGLFEETTFSWLDKQAHREQRSILFEAILPHLPASEQAALEQKSDNDDLVIDISPDVDEPAMQALRREWQTTRESSHHYICSSKNWQEFFERVALRYFDTRIPTTRWEKMHQWWELVLTTLPPISAGLALQVLKEMEADDLGNSTTPGATTTAAGSSSEQLNRPVTIAWIVLGSLVFAERLAATVGFSPQKPAMKRLWRYATWAVELTLALGAMGAASVVTALPVNNDTDYLSNLALSMGKAHAGAAMIGHANGFAMLIAPLVMMIGCTPTLRNIINKSSRTLTLMGFLSAGAILSSNPIGSAVFTIGSYSQPFILAIQAAGNFANSVLPTILGTGLALGIGAAFIFASYRIPAAYKAFAGLIFAMGLGLAGVSVANFAVPLSDYISGATTQIPDWVAFIVAHSDEFVWGTVGAAALMVVVAVTVVECTRQEKAPSYFPAKVKCLQGTQPEPAGGGRSRSASTAALRATSEAAEALVPDEGVDSKMQNYGGTSTAVSGPGQRPGNE